MGIYTVLSQSTTPSLSDYIDSGLITKLGNLVTSILGWCTSNPILALFFTVSFVFMGFGIIAKLKGVIRVR